MSIGLLGKKLGMTRIFDPETGAMTAVTVVDVSGNVWLQKKTTEKEGYSAIQVGFDEKKVLRESRPMQGHFAAYGAAPCYLVQEFRVDSDEELPDTDQPHPGAALFTDGQWIDVIGTTRGKGFQGVVKRYGFKGQKMTHGSMMHRRPGAIAAGTSPGLVWKNQKMPGHEGVRRRTTQSLRIAQVRPEDGVVLVSGGIPGSKGSYVVIRPAKKKPAPSGK